MAPVYTPPRQIALIGATGVTGGYFLALALAEGHTVRALVRDPDRLGRQHDKLEVHTGDATVEADVRRLLAGCDAVVCSIANRGRKGMGEQADLFTRSTRVLVDAARATKVRRVVLMMSGAIVVPGEKRSLRDRFSGRLVRVIAGPIIDDAQHGFELLIGEGQDLDWTVVRPGNLVDKPATGAVLAGVDLPVGPAPIANADVARFMLEELGARRYVRQAPRIKPANAR